MRVLHVLNTGKYSGAENVVCQIIDIFSNNQSVNVDMIYCSPDGPIRTSLEERSIQFCAVKRLTVSELKRAIKQTTPDIVHAHDMKATLVAAMCCGKIPLISHIHNNQFENRRISVKSLAYFFAAIKAQHIFWVSETSCYGYIFHKPLLAKSSVLHNIINVKKLYGRKNSDNHTYNYDVIYLGRFSYQKNPHRLLDVCNILANKKRNIKIAFVGTGDLLEEVQLKAKEMNLVNNVSFLGYIENPIKILYDSKVMLMTSRWEGLPMCALESMALGTPVVATPVDGLKNIIDNGETGYLCDDNNDIAETILELLADTKRLNEMSEKTIAWSIVYNDTTKYGKAIYAIYQRCISKRI